MTEHTEYTISLELRTDRPTADVVTRGAELTRLLELDDDVQVVNVDITRWDEDDDGELHGTPLVTSGIEDL